MKRGMIIWGVLTLIVWVISLFTADDLTLQYAASMVAMSALMTVFVAMAIEVMLVLFSKNSKQQKI